MKSVSTVFFGLIVLLSNRAVAKDLNCVDCNKGNERLVASQPNKGPIKELMKETAEPVRVAAAYPSMAVINKDTKGTLNDFVYRYCLKFGQADADSLDILFDEMEASPYPDVYNYLSTPACQPRAYGNDVKIPAVQLIADDAVQRKKFLEIIQTYFNFIEKPELLKKLLNTKSVPKNETFLDYIETKEHQSQYQIEGLAKAKKEIVAFACANGAEYSVYKNKKCP